MSTTPPTCSRKAAPVGLHVTAIDTDGVHRGENDRPVPRMPLAVNWQRVTVYMQRAPDCQYSVHRAHTGDEVRTLRSIVPRAPVFSMTLPFHTPSQAWTKVGRGDGVGVGVGVGDGYGDGGEGSGVSVGGGYGAGDGVGYGVDGGYVVACCETHARCERLQLDPLGQQCPSVRCIPLSHDGANAKYAAVPPPHSSRNAPTATPTISPTPDPPRCGCVGFCHGEDVPP